MTKIKQLTKTFTSNPLTKLTCGTLAIISACVISTALIRHTPDIAMLTPLGLLPLTGIAGAIALHTDRR